jgi:hypothetical protein
MAEEEK